MEVGKTAKMAEKKSDYHGLNGKFTNVRKQQFNIICQYRTSKRVEILRIMGLVAQPTEKDSWITARTGWTKSIEFYRHH
jgi:hypothetical protein